MTRSITGTNSRVLDSIIDRVTAVAEPRRILLFGSTARGDAQPGSDYDLLVVVAGDVHRRALAQKIYGNLHGIPVPVDVIVATERDVAMYGDKIGTILRPALQDGVTIYEAPN